MKPWPARLLLLAALLAIGLWVWHTFFPNPEKLIRKRLAELAQAASFSSNESPLARLANAQKLTTFFTADVEATLDIPGRSHETFSGRDELLQRALGARSAVNGLSVELPDIQVIIAPDRHSAIVNLTAKARVPGEKDFYVQELRLNFRKIDREWLIRRLETVKSLSRRTGHVPMSV